MDVKFAALVLCLSAVTATAAQPAIERQIDAMPVDERLAQLLIVGYDGHTMTAELKQLVRDRRVGGVVLYAHNFQSPAQIRGLTASIAAAGGDPPPFLAVDQEGGIVHRLGDGAVVLPSAMALGATRSPELARRAGQAVGSALHDFGFTMNFAPVLDVLSDPRNESIGTRAFGDDPGLVATIGSAFIEGQSLAGIVSVAKHFPGLGGVAEDTHRMLPRLEVDARVLASRELVPFRAALRQPLAAVMSGHVSVPALTGGRDVPATMSSAVMTGLLRRTIRFDGVAISDALQMDALERRRGAGDLAVDAILAGSDMLLALGKPAERDDVLRALRTAYNSGRLPARRVRESLRRILTLKAALRATQPKIMPLAERSATLDSIARAAVTVLDDRVKLLPLRTQTFAYIGPEGALSHALPNARSLSLPNRASKERWSELAAVAVATSRAETVIVAAAENGDQFALLLELRKRLPEARMIFVNLGSPFRIIRDNAACTILTYAEDERSQQAAVDVILGRARATGIAPVAMP